MPRSKAKPGGEFMDALAGLPWWTGLALAAVFFAVFHQLAQPLALVGGFVLPGLCVAAAFGTFARRLHRERLLRGISHSRSPEDLVAMSWHDMEMLVGEAFRQQGYDVHERSAPSPDGAADIELSRDGEVFLVQCRHWRQARVGVAIVREFYGLMSRSGASGGYLITSGRFSDDAVAFAQDTHLQLVDGKELFELLQQARSRRAS